MVTWKGYLTENTLKHVKAQLRACGWKGTNLANMSPEQIQAALPTAAELRIEIESWEGDGKEKRAGSKAVVAYVQEVGGRNERPLAPKVAEDAFGMLCANGARDPQSEDPPYEEEQRA